MRRSTRNLDNDDDVFDSTIYDPKYSPKRVYRDGKGPTVRLMLTDSMPPEYRAAISRRPLYDASAVKGQVFDPADFVIRTDGVCRLNPEMARMVVAKVSA
jgi:hypothetical protein